MRVQFLWRAAGPNCNPSATALRLDEEGRFVACVRLAITYREHLECGYDYSDNYGDDAKALKSRHFLFQEDNRKRYGYY